MLVIASVAATLLLAACGGDRESLRAKPVANEPSEFLRLVDDDSGARLETAIVSYKNEAGVTVDLVAAVHVGDARYYDELEDYFRSRDRVLYELVAPEGTRPQRGADASGGLGFMQRSLKSILELEFQLDGIDYGARNFVHADLDPEGFARAQRERGESIWAVLLNVWIEEVKRASRGEGPSMTLPELYAAFTSEDRARSMKRLLAEQFENMERMMAAFDVGNDGSALVTDRNTAALDVLRREIGKGARTLAIFYGAAHMPDFEQRLGELGFAKIAHRWVTAWDIR